MKHRINYSGGSDIGCRRSANQDNLTAGRYCMRKGMQHKILPPGDAEITEAFAIGVFDGLGGEEQGEEAAYIAAESMARWHPGACPAGEIEAHFLHMNREICRFAEENGIHSIGTTAAVLLFTEKEIYAVNLGDSRIFVLEDGGLRQISKDDVLPLWDGPKKPPITQCLGIPPEEMRIEPHIQRLPYRAGQRFLICSDGLTDAVPDAEIAGMLSRIPLDRLPEALIEKTLENGGRDNVTVMVSEVVQ